MNHQEKLNNLKEDITKQVDKIFNRKTTQIRSRDFKFEQRDQ